MARARLAIALLLLMGLVAGCGRGSQGGEAELEKLTFMLDWYPNTNHTGLYVAKERGFFAAEGLDVDIIQSGDTGASQAVAAGRADFGVASSEMVTPARAEGVPVVAVAALYQHNTSAFAALKESGIRGIADFEGKRYGGWGSPIEEAIVRALMERHGADFGSLEMVTLGQADFFATIGREADISWIFYGWDGVEAERRGIELETIFLRDLDPVFDYYTPLIVTSEKMIAERPETVRRFLRALARGYADAMAEPEAAAEILLAHAPELNPDLVKQSQAWLASVDTLDRVEGRPYWGYQDRERWERFAGWMYEAGLIDGPIDVDKAFTNEFLPKADEL